MNHEETVERIDMLNNRMAASIALIDDILRDILGSPTPSVSDDGESDGDFAMAGTEDEVVASAGVDFESPVITTRHVRFADDVYIIADNEEPYIANPSRLSFDSDGTMRINYTPWWYNADLNEDGECSDTDTIVDEYESPITPIAAGRMFLHETDDDETEDEDGDI